MLQSKLIGGEKVTFNNFNALFKAAPISVFILTIHQMNVRYFTHQNNMKLSLSFAVVSQPLELFNQFKVSASFQSI